MIKQHLRNASRPATVLATLALVALLGASLTLAVAELVSPAAVAAEPGPTPAPDRAITQNTGRVLTRAIELLNADRFLEAREQLDTLDLAILSPFERSRYEQLMFNLAMNAEDFAGARAHLQEAINSGGLNEKESAQMRYQMAQLYVQEENYPAAAEALDRWIASQESPNSAAYYLLAASYYYMEDYEAALPHAQQAVELASGEPQEAWLGMLAALYMQLDRPDAAEQVLERMVQRFPDKAAYRTQLEELRTQ